MLHRVSVALLALCLASMSHAAELKEARIYIEYNFSANDLGFHVFLDGEDWKTLTIFNPKGERIFEVGGTGGYAELGMTELFFEGAEPSLSEVDLEELLERFPAGEYTFEGMTVGGESIRGTAELSHAVPDAPIVSARVRDDVVTIRWNPVTRPAEILPDHEVEIVSYQVLVESLQVTLPAPATKLTLPREFVRTLEPGVIAFEVLAIDVSGNQTITEGTFFWNEPEETRTGTPDSPGAPPPLASLSRRPPARSRACH